MSKSFSFTDKNGDSYPQWEEKSLGEIGSTYSGLSGKTKEDFGVGDHKFITYMNVFSNVIADSLMVQKIRINEGEKQNEVIQGDILFTTSSETPKEVGMASLWDQDSTAFLNSFCFGFRIADSKVLPHYLVRALHSPLGREKISFLAQGSTRYNISKTKLMEIQFPIPSLPEQQKIAEFFSALDERIALTANKVELLKEQKQGYLQKVFSRELVFTDNNGDTYADWEQKKLSDVAKLVTGTTPDTTNPEYWGGDHPWVTPADMGRKKNLDSSGRTVTKLGLQKSRGLPAGSLLVTCIGATIGKMAILSVEGSCNQQNNAVLPSDSISVGYLYYFLATQVDKMKSLAGKTATPILNKTAFGLLPVAIPSLPEQQKIAEFFSALDEQIELTENKLALLKEQKKGYLQGIFG